MMLPSPTAIVTAALLFQTVALPVSPGTGAPLAPAARGDAAIERGDWAAAIDAFAEAEHLQPLDPVVVLKLGTAQARAGHELPAIAWLRCYLSIVPSAPNRASLISDILRLQLQAESRIKRILQEGSEGILQIGDVDPDTLAEVQQLVMQNALAAGRVDEANRTAAAVDESKRNELWTAVAGAFASEGDIFRAEQAAANVTGTSADALRASLGAVAAATRPVGSAPERWESLARELSVRSEVVALNRVLADAATADPRTIPVRLLEVGSSLRGWFARIQRLTEEVALEGRE
jgi:hypothetical protein